MIESYYWKEYLRRSGTKLRKWQNQHRWSAQSITLFERELMLAFFCIRRIKEFRKVTDSCASQKIGARVYRNNGERVDLSNRFKIERLYELGSGRKAQLTLSFAANQLTHCFIIITVFGENGTPQGVLVSSDFERNKCLYHFSLRDLLRAVQSVVGDRVTHVHMRRHPKTEDMEIISIS